MPGRRNRTRGTRRGAPLVVSTVITDAAPTGTNAVEFDHSFTATANYNIPVGVAGAPSRPTSFTASFTSGSNAVWRVYCTGTTTGVSIFESRPFVTNGSTVEVHFRAPKSTDFVGANAENCLWTVRCVIAGTSVTARACGVARGSYRGCATPSFSPSIQEGDTVEYLAN